LAAQPVGLGAAASDDDPGARGVQVDADTVTGALDLDLGDTGPLETGGHELADRHVLVHVVRVALSLLGGVREPARAVIGRDTETVSVWMYLLAHISEPLPWSGARDARRPPR